MKAYLATLMLVLSSVTVAAADIGAQPDDYRSSFKLANVFSTSATGGLQPVVIETGKVAWSIDALGSNTGSGLIQVEKPAGATVRKAYLMAASTGFTGYKITNSDITLAGSPVTFTSEVASGISSFNYFTDVTSIVKPIVDGAGAGVTDLTVTEASTFSIDGVTLVVIFDDASKPDSTIILAFGAQQTAGDTFNIGLADPVNTSASGFLLDMSLGISYSFQPAGQFSQIDINGARLTTSAGGQDDGQPENGALITTGGVGNSNANPANPNQGDSGGPTYDDELYDLTSYVNNGDTSIVADTLNPSSDDNIYFAGFFLGATTAVVGEGVVLSPQSATNFLGADHTITATVQDTNGDPIVGVDVTFDMVSGPNTGMTATTATDAQGKATFTWTSGSVGTDEVVASFVNGQQQKIESNHVTKTWEADYEIPEFGVIGGMVVMLGALGLIAFRRQ